MVSLRPAPSDSAICAKCGHENLYFSVRCTRCGSALATALHLLPGEAERPVIGGELAIGTLIGRGAFSSVHRVWNGEQALAVKLFARHSKAVKCHFQREVAALRRIEHAGVARLVGAGHLGDHAWIVMPEYRGPTLRAMLDAAIDSPSGDVEGGPLGLDTTLQIARGLASALEAIHERGFVHRDLKPENVVITTEGPVLLDFGFADRRSTSGLSERASRIAGTLPYIAPEHLAGARAEAEADLFSLGCVLFEMLAGFAPFGDTGVVRAVLEGRPGALPEEIPSEVAALAFALLDREPAARPKSAARWLRDLTETFCGRRAARPSLPGSARTTRTPRRYSRSPEALRTSAL
jgi:serine/threonine protein kinase